jgi:hypothetical protein
MIDGALAETQEQYQTLLEAKPRPHVLDDYTVGRVTKVYGDQRQDVAHYAEQIARWADEPLTTAQRDEVARLQTQVKKLGEVTAAILSLAQELKAGTIDRLLEKSEVEVGLEFLQGKWKL